MFKRKVLKFRINLSMKDNPLAPELLTPTYHDYLKKSFERIFAGHSIRIENILSSGNGQEYVEISDWYGKMFKKKHLHYVYGHAKGFSDGIEEFGIKIRVHKDDEI